LSRVAEEAEVLVADLKVYPDVPAEELEADRNRASVEDAERRLVRRGMNRVARASTRRRERVDLLIVRVEIEWFGSGVWRGGCEVAVGTGMGLWMEV
jgi:hypothetical protein